MQTNKKIAQAAKRPKHSTRRETRGRDRRAEIRTERELLTIVLHPALFEKNMGVAA